MKMHKDYITERKKMKDGISLLDIKESFRLFLRFNKYILRYWKPASIIFILGNFSIALSLLYPYIGKNVLDKGVVAKDIRVFMIYTAVGIGIYLVSLVVNSFCRYLTNYVIRKMRVDLTKDVFKKMNKYSLGFFQQKPTGTYIFRISHNIASASNMINAVLPNIVMAIFKLIAISIVIVFINWKILILIIGYQLFVLFQINLFIKKLERIIKSSLDKSEDIFKRLNEFFSHIYVVKAFGTITKEIRKYFHDFVKKMRLELDETKLIIISETVRNASDKLLFGIVAFYCSIMVIKGQMTLGSLAAIMAYLAMGIGAYASLLYLGQRIVLNRVLLERVTALFDAEVDIKEKDDAKRIKLCKGRIEFKNVSFAYKENVYVLKSMDFNIPPGAYVAIAGVSGCGKTTLLNLMLRLHDPTEGAVFLDDYDIKDFKFRSIYDQIGIALQEPFLWNDTVSNNILYGKEKADMAEVAHAAKLAEIHDFIMSLPQKYETAVGENAYSLSEGQKERIAIARAVIKRPKILILDEAMASLDSETEDKIMNNIRKEFKDSTIIVVSHRLSTVKKMDTIYFLRNNSFIETGTHDELLERNPEYRKLFASQIEQMPQDEILT